MCFATSLHKASLSVSRDVFRRHLSVLNGCYLVVKKKKGKERKREITTKKKIPPLLY